MCCKTDPAPRGYRIQVIVNVKEVRRIFKKKELPADSPQIVIRVGSPPNFEIYPMLENLETSKSGKGAST